MRRFSEIKEHRYYETIKNSVEHRHDRWTAIFISIITVIFLALTFAIFDTPSKSKSMVSMFFGLLIMVPYSLYCTYRAVIPFFHMGSYSFTEVLLDKPHHRGKGSMYFTVILRDRMGREFEADTHAIFGYGRNPIFEDYINQKALIAYNEKTETVLLIKRIPEITN